MGGAANRRRGHDAERAVARWLVDHDYTGACTTRAALGHDGTRQPGDVIIPGIDIVISVKDVAGSAWPTWKLQAAVEAGPARHWIVVRRKRGCVDVGLWPACADHGTRFAFDKHDFADVIEQFRIAA